MIRMILKDLMIHFSIDEDLPEYLLNQTFNKVFLDGKLTKEGELPTGLLNGMKFPQNESVGIPINKL